MIGTLYQLLYNKLGLVSGAAVLLEIIGKEENFQDGKHNEQFDDDDGPEGLAQCHLPESVVV